MDPTYHHSRRVDRAKCLASQTPADQTTTYYTDAAFQDGQANTATSCNRVCVIRNHHMNVLTPLEAELPCYPTNSIPIKTDSQVPCRASLDSTLPHYVFENLKSNTYTSHPQLQVTSQWTLGYSSIHGNELTYNDVSQCEPKWE